MPEGWTHAPTGRKKLKRRAARDDSSESTGQGDPGNQLVHYQGNGGADFLSSLVSMDGLGDSGDSAEARRNQPNLTEVRASLGCRTDQLTWLWYVNLSGV